MKKLFIITALFSVTGAFAQTTTTAPVAGQTSATTAEVAKSDSPLKPLIYLSAGRSLRDTKAKSEAELSTLSYFSLGYTFNPTFNLAVRQILEYSINGSENAEKQKPAQLTYQQIVLTQNLPAILGTKTTNIQYRYALPTGDSIRDLASGGIPDVTSTLEWELSPKITLGHYLRINYAIDSDDQKNFFGVRFNDVAIKYAFNDNITFYQLLGSRFRYLNRLGEINKGATEGDQKSANEALQKASNNDKAIAGAVSPTTFGETTNQAVMHVETGFEIQAAKNLYIQPAIAQAHLVGSGAKEFQLFDPDSTEYSLEAVVTF